MADVIEAFELRCEEKECGELAIVRVWSCGCVDVVANFREDDRLKVEGAKTWHTKECALRKPSILGFQRKCVTGAENPNSPTEEH